MDKRVRHFPFGVAAVEGARQTDAVALERESDTANTYTAQRYLFHCRYGCSCVSQMDPARCAALRQLCPLLRDDWPLHPCVAEKVYLRPVFQCGSRTYREDERNQT